MTAGAAPGTTPRPAPGPSTGAPDTGGATTLLLVRHGRTSWTDERLACGGELPGPPLTAEGEDEARRLAAQLASGELTPDRPTVVVASPTLRTLRTAELLAEPFGLPVTEDPGWVEMGLGEWHGRGFREIAERWPEEFAAWRGSSAVAPPGGESIDALAARVAAVRDRTLAVHAGATVLVVAHVGPVRSVVAWALDAGPAAYWRLRVSPASLSITRHWADGGAEVGGVNLGVPSA